MILVGCCVPGGTLGLEKEGQTPVELFAAKCRYILSIGYDYVECSAGVLLGFNEAELNRLKEEDARDSLNLRAVNCIFPGHLHLLRMEEQTEEIRAHCDKLFSSMDVLGIPYAVFGSGASRMIPEGMSAEEAKDRMEKFLDFLADAAFAHGVTIVIEPLRQAETNILNTVAESGDAVKRVNKPAMKLLCDSYHMAMEGTDVSEMLPYAEDILHCHIAEAPTRCYPGKYEGGDLSYNRHFGEVLQKLGYTGGVSAECGFRDFVAESPVACAYMKEIFGRSNG